MPEPIEPINPNNARGHKESLDYESVEIPAEFGSDRSANYFIAKTIIENGIANSVDEGLAVYIVRLQLPATAAFKAEEVDMSLGQYLASGRLSGSVSNEEYKALLAEYNPLNIAYQELHKHDPNTNDPIVRNIGSTAILDYKPIPRSHSSRSFKDWKCAAANDYSDDDNS